MLRFPDHRSLLAAALLLVFALPAAAGPLGLGREATPEEVALWDIDVRPDGAGLPEGSGTVAMGEEIFTERCAYCHGDFGEGIDNWPVLAGGRGTLKDDRPIKTVGSYWPYASTLFDYIYRAMPFGDAQSLDPDEVYGLVAYILNMNDLLPADGEVSRQSLPGIRMPNVDNFIPDARPDAPVYGQEGPCMKNCKTDVKIVMRASIIDVTPEVQQ